MIDPSFHPAAGRPPLDAIYFAGAGGSSQGYEEALGKHPDVALNHNAFAIGVHAFNFPETEHLIADVFDVDPRVLRPGQKWRSWWFSPDCRHHSAAKGGALLDSGTRGLAWVIIKVCKLLGDDAPDVVFLENVVQWRDWGPLYRAGQVVDGAPLAEDDPRVGRPIPELKGKIYETFCRRMEQCGYVTDSRDLIAYKFGDPTTRKRLFQVWRRDGMPIRWPEPTHAPPEEAAAKGLKVWRTAADIIDWSVEPPSIFDRPRSLAKATRKRIAKGIERHVVRSAKPYLVQIANWSREPTYPVEEPLRTQTASPKGGSFALVKPTLAGGSVFPLTHRDDSNRERALDEPPPAVTGANRGELALGAAYLVPHYGEAEGQAPRSLGVDRPYPTAVKNGNGGDLAAAFLGRQFGSTVSGRTLGEPHPAVMTDGAGGKSQLVAATISRQFGASVGSNAGAPLGAVMPGGSGKTSLVAASIDKYYASGVAQAVDRPLDAATSKARFSLNAAYLEQAGSDSIGHSAAEPVSTILQAGCHQRLVSVGMVPANDNDGSSRRAQVVAFLWEHFGAPTEAEWADPAGTLEARVKFGLVVIDGQVWQIVDIGMRMLLPAELKRAMGWPDSFETGISAIHGRITKTREVAGIGNGVCRQTAAALIRENLGPGRWIPPELRGEANAVRRAA